MDTGVISAGAALIGASIGGAMSFFGSWVVQQKQMRAQWLGQDRRRRQDLYKEFIQEASKAYADSIQHDRPNVGSLVSLYGKISRMRAISSPQVIDAGDKILRRIIDIYLKPPVMLTGPQIRTMINEGGFDVLRDFSESCRAEFDALTEQV